LTIDTFRRLGTSFFRYGFTNWMPNDLLYDSACTEAGTNAVLKVLGYRLRTKATSHKSKAAAGGDFALSFVIENTGSSQPYLPNYQLEVSCLDSNHNVITRVYLALPAIIVGDTSIAMSMKAPGVKGTYDIAIAVVDSDKIPRVSFSGGTAYSNRHVMSSIEAV